MVGTEQAGSQRLSLLWRTCSLNVQDKDTKEGKRNDSGREDKWKPITPEV